MKLVTEGLKWRTLLLIVLSLLLVPGLAWADSASKHRQFTTEFNLADCTLSNTGGNALFTLDYAAGMMNPILLQGEEEKELVQVQITVLNATESIDLTALGLGNVNARVIREVEWIDGEQVEWSENYFIRCAETNDIYCLGEDVTLYEYDDEGNLVETIEGAEAGAWRAGELAEDGESINQPGLIMPGTFLLGARYYQEIAPEVALDRAEHIDMGLEVETPAGLFSDSVKLLETTPLEPEAKDIKIYADGYGLIVDDPIERVNNFDPVPPPPLP